MLLLAQECGLRVARHRIETVAGKDLLLVQRFDRTLTADGYLRHRMVSGLTALGAEDSQGDRAQCSDCAHRALIPVTGQTVFDHLPAGIPWACIHS